MINDILNKLPDKVAEEIEIQRDLWEENKKDPRLYELKSIEAMSYCRALKQLGLITTEEKRTLLNYMRP